MGVIAELVAASKREALSIATSANPSRYWMGIVWKGLDHIKLASLWSILICEPIQVDNVVERSHLIGLVAEASEDGPWVFAIPEDLRDQLASLSGESYDRLHTIVTAWAGTDEFQEWAYSDVADLFQEIIDLADRASLDGNDMFLWICL